MKKTITVTTESRIERIRWADHKLVDDGSDYKSRRPMTKVTEIIRGEVEVQLDLAEIVVEIARQALRNTRPKATILSGKIRARVLTSQTDETREPSGWANLQNEEERCNV